MCLSLPTHTITVWLVTLHQGLDACVNNELTLVCSVNKVFWLMLLQLVWEFLNSYDHQMSQSVRWQVAAVLHCLLWLTPVICSLLFSSDPHLSASLPPNPSIRQSLPSLISPACHWRYRPVMWPIRQIQSPSIPGCLSATWTQRWWRSRMWKASSPSMAGCWAAQCTRATPSSSTPVRGTPGGLWSGRMAGCWPDRRWVSPHDTVWFIALLTELEKKKWWPKWLSWINVWDTVHLRSYFTLKWE